MNTGIVYLAFNKLTGSVPSEIGQLTNAKNHIYFQNNGLSGIIPTQLGNLMKLSTSRQLNLGYNSLTFTIPTELGKLPTASLNLVHNKLCSGVPTELAAFDSEYIFNGNNLEEECPEFPTPLPSLSPTSTLVPTFAPTRCGPGSFEDYDSDGTGRGCTPCPPGKFSGEKSAPMCTVCGAVAGTTTTPMALKKRFIMMRSAAGSASPGYQIKCERLVRIVDPVLSQETARVIRARQENMPMIQV